MDQHIKDPSIIAPEPVRRTSRGRGILTGCLVLAVLAGIVWWTRQQSPPQQAGGGRNAGPMSIVPETVGKGDIGVSLNALGTVTSLATVTIRSQISGYLMKIDFKEGDEVKKGDLIAEIDSRPYEATLAQAKGTLARDEAQLKGAQVDLTRYQNLATQNAVPHQTLDTQVALVAQYQGTVEADRASVKSAEVNLQYCHIVSPINGRVGLRQVDLGNYVTPGDTNGLVVITQLEPISVLFTLPEDNLQAVAKRMKEGAVLPTAAYDRSGANKLAEGSLQTFDSQIDATTGTIKLRAQFENDKRTLYPNQFVNIRLLLDTHKDATTMPTAGIQRGVPGTFVYLVNADSTVSVRPVKLGVTDGDRVEVLSGLVPGDHIVIDGADKLREGAKVIVRSAADAANPAAAAKGGPNGAAKGEGGAEPDKAGGGHRKRSEDGQTK
ncbi:MdtA/MuxA family multidrug efflux RND transporter periplasmic adaptor subunit [Bradyrhizobium septentrionale]|uniref:MdtA/MuxA family multidrug efflux RND transporter periplasmic adaptor subunit n=1 Tax=Bradyrhizobium septentrionale TaxID=1404411 RepID=A0ABZ2NQ07_9BRAD|nr:MdtA/MuxA family multidrug efflux RND transporter periplasmic adaptor subunit [Bradyrhizobium septentrionale]UGY14071.1 MdtA/MuxA family multidrug efflux RND transporter periplasmic adaptor subunit [Bradyrhizobium septentrionale]UGY22626.1 MdtA/MuxA family multidrug efflux RND transporter periplasmic adaptor subunit [Bradyrhizobium septentrionale]